MSDIQSHITSITIDAPAEKAFDFMRDPAKLSSWSFGTWEAVLHEDGMIEGKAIFDGTKTFVRIDADPLRLLIDYHLGADRAALTPRISVRVVPGERLDLGPAQAVLTFIAWRPASMGDDRWRRLTASHEFEVVLLKSLIPADAKGTG